MKGEFKTTEERGNVGLTRTTRIESRARAKNDSEVEQCEISHLPEPARCDAFLRIQAVVWEKKEKKNKGQESHLSWERQSRQRWFALRTRLSDEERRTDLKGSAFLPIIQTPASPFSLFTQLTVPSSDSKGGMGAAWCFSSRLTNPASAHLIPHEHKRGNSGEMEAKKNPHKCWNSCS